MRTLIAILIILFVATPAHAEVVAPRLSIPLIGVDRDTVRVLDGSTPRHDVAWNGRRVGNIVFWAHVSRFRSEPSIPAPFNRLGRLRPGDEVIVDDHTYHVADVYYLDASASTVMANTRDTRITLITCEAQGKKRLVVIAK